MSDSTTSSSDPLAWVHDPGSETMEAHARAMRNAGLVELPALTEVHFTGADRARFLHNLCTNDVLRLVPGSGCEAFVTNVQGKTIGHGIVFCETHRLAFVTVAGQADVLLPHWDRYLITEDVQLLDRSPELCHLLVFGPQAAAVVDRATQVDGLTSTLAGPWDHRPVGGETSGGTGTVNAMVRHVSMLATQAYLLAVAASDRDAWAGRLGAAGAASVPPEVFQMARVEAGWPRFGWDISDRNLPQEVDRDALAISFRKGCYLGQETVARIDALGHVNRMLTRLVSSDTLTPCPGTPLLIDGQAAGEVTSSAFSPTRGKGLALAYVRCSVRTPGTVLVTPEGKPLTVDERPSGPSTSHSSSTN